MQHKYGLDYQLSSFIKKPKALDSWVRQLLRISLYQIHYLDRVPEHAIVNEAVMVAKERGHKGISGLVNGVLRTILRSSLPSFKAISDPIERLSIQYSLPSWMVRSFVDSLGIEAAENVARSFQEKAKVSIRVNTNVLSRKEAAEKLAEEGFETRESPLSPAGLICQGGQPAHSSLFQSGVITIQDESSMLVAPALQVHPYHHVLDACAAPGGKTTHIASYLDYEKGGKVIALDLHRHKVKLIKENALRQHVDQVVDARVMDARKLEEQLELEFFDRVLVDAPCSGLGLMRRKPDIRYTKTKEDVRHLQKVQLDILNHAAEKVKVDGQVVYSTCTLTREENQQVVEHFLSTHPNFKRIPVFIENEQAKRSEDGSVTIYPHTYHTDGFFISTLKKYENLN